MKNFKKIGALLLALAMVFAMSVAVAENTFTSNVGAADTKVTWTDTFTISSGDDAVNLPAAKFNYTIAAAAENDGLQDADPEKKIPAVKAGVDSPSITKVADHAATAADADKPTESKVDVTADFSEVTFPAPGIYRYKVTVAQDSNNVTKDDIKIDVGNSNKGEYYLDVYVINKNGTYTPSAYILSKTADALKYDNSNKVNYENKVDEIKHEYTTYNLTVKKVIQGDMAAQSFDFTVDVTLPTGVIADLNGTNSTSTTEKVTATLKNNETIVIKGLPRNATYKIGEAVNKVDGYTITVEGATSTYNDAGTRHEMSAAATMGAADVNVTYTNKLESISPTGLILRIAPYAMILAAGILLLVISKKRKADAE